MVELVFSPNWFYGKDIGIDAVSVITLLIITVFSYKLYKISKEQKSALFTIGFLSLAISFIFKILTNFELYYSTLETQTQGLITFSYSIVKTSNIPLFIGFLGYRALTFLGLYLLYLVYYGDKTDKVSMALQAYFLFVALYFTQFSYYVFFMTNAIFLALITKKLWDNSTKNNRSQTALSLATSFSIITASQILFMFTGMFPILYVLGELVQLIGSAMLLWTLALILYHGKKTQ